MKLDGDEHGNMGACLGKIGKHKEAIEHYKMAITLKPYDADWTRNLSVALLKVGKYIDALAAAQRALQIDPQHSHSHIYLGQCYRDLCLWNEAEVCYKQAISLNSNNPLAIGNLGIVYRQ